MDVRISHKCHCFHSDSVGFVHVQNLHFVRIEHFHSVGALKKALIALWKHNLDGRVSSGMRKRGILWARLAWPASVRPGEHTTIRGQRRSYTARVVIDIPITDFPAHGASGPILFGIWTTHGGACSTGRGSRTSAAPPLYHLSRSDTLSVTPSPYISYLLSLSPQIMIV